VCPRASFCRIRHFGKYRLMSARPARRGDEVLVAMSRVCSSCPQAYCRVSLPVFRCSSVTNTRYFLYSLVHWNFGRFNCQFSRQQVEHDTHRDTVRNTLKQRKWRSLCKKQHVAYARNKSVQEINVCCYRADIPCAFIA
jgi:hypothetical protein